MSNAEQQSFANTEYFYSDSSTEVFATFFFLPLILSVNFKISGSIKLIFYLANRNRLH